MGRTEWLHAPPRFVLRIGARRMRIRYFEDTDTLLIELRDAQVVQTRDLDENTLVDVDAQGRLVAITIEHAKDRAELGRFTYERVEA
jgi:uncharacterized protein YuzE